MADTDTPFTRILILDDDPESVAYYSAVVISKIPRAHVESRCDPLVEGQWDLCIFDDDFGGAKRACRIASQLHCSLPACRRIAISGCFSDISRQALLAMRCDAVCDKADPGQFLDALKRLAPAIGDA